MPSETDQKRNPIHIRELIFSWLQSHLDTEAIDWLEEKAEQLKDDAEDWVFFTSFSAVPRYTGKADLNLSEQEQAEAQKLKDGWQPENWTVDQLARTYLVLCIAEKDKSIFLDWLEKTFVTSDTSEAIALYQSLPVLPWPKDLTKRAAEGIRSNMTSVFNAVALRNPFPSEHMDEDAFNQVVLKALFVESPLYLIHGIDQRANEKLARMLVDYAHERWSADRSVSPELWRPVGPFAKDNIIDNLEKVVNHPDEIQQQAAVLALSASSSPEAKKLVDKNQDIAQQIEDKNVTWNDIGRRANS